MVKVVKFWDIVCDQLNYRFFSGVVCKEFDGMYKRMNPKKMHYIPAVNECNAIGIVIATAFSGIKSAVFIDGKQLNNLLILDSFIDSISSVFIIFASGTMVPNNFLWPVLKINKNTKNVEKELHTFDKKLLSNNTIGVVLIEEGVIV